MDLKIDALLFDKDGTLFDFHLSWGPWLTGFLQEIAKDQSHKIQLAQALGFDLQSQKFMSGSVFVHDTLEEILDVMMPLMPDQNRAELKAVAIRETADVPQVPIVPLAELLNDFKGMGLLLGVATNDNEGPAIAQLEQAGVAQYFDFIAGYDSGYGGKPATGMQQAFCKSLGLEASRVAMVGDSLHDLTSGRDAGMITIGVLTGVTIRDDLAPLADVILNDISEIMALLAKD